MGAAGDDRRGGPRRRRRGERRGVLAHHEEDQPLLNIRGSSDPCMQTILCVCACSPAQFCSLSYLLRSFSQAVARWTWLFSVVHCGLVRVFVAPGNGKCRESTQPSGGAMPIASRRRVLPFIARTAGESARPDDTAPSFAEPSLRLPSPTRKLKTTSLETVVAPFSRTRTSTPTFATPARAGGPRGPCGSAACAGVQRLTCTPCAGNTWGPPRRCATPQPFLIQVWLALVLLA